MLVDRDLYENFGGVAVAAEWGDGEGSLDVGVGDGALVEADIEPVERDTEA
jgi:hypothetical protein